MYPKVKGLRLKHIHALMNPSEITKWHPCLEDPVCPAEEALSCRTAIAKSMGSFRLEEDHKFKVNLGTWRQEKQNYIAHSCMLQALLVTISYKKSFCLPCSPHQKPTPGQGFLKTSTASWPWQREPSLPPSHPATKIEGEILTELEGLYLWNYGQPLLPAVCIRKHLPEKGQTQKWKSAAGAPPPARF